MIPGNTVRVTGTFQTWAGSAVDPDNPVLKIYENKIVLETIPITVENRISAGTYQIDYVVPEGSTGLVFSFEGTVEGKPEIARLQVGRNFV